MHLPGNQPRRRVARLFVVALCAITASSLTHAAPPRVYYNTYPNDAYFDTPEDACDNLNNFFYARDKWTYDDIGRICIHAEGSFFVKSIRRCAPDASEPDTGPEDEQCGGPFFWSKTVSVRDIEDESCQLGNPVGVGTGVKSQTEPDIPGTEHVPTLERTYRSQVRFAASDSFGPNWTHQWNRQIQFPSPSSESISLLRADGSARTFQKSGTGWKSTSGRDTITLASMPSGRLNWRYLDASDDSIEIYDERGRLLQAVARNGRTTTLTYGKSGQLDHVANQFGQGYRFQYDSSGRIAAITDPTARTTLYEYNDWGMLAAVIHPDGTRRTYHYENSPYRSVWTHQLTGITDEADVRYSTYEYDANGRVTSTELAGGIDRVTLVYSNELETARTYPFGTPATIYRHTRVGNRLLPSSIEGPAPENGGTRSVVYGANGDVASTVDFNDGETRYAYDQQGRETQRTEDTGRPNQRTVSTEWHSHWNLPTRIAKPNRIDTIEYDSNAQPILHTWHATTDTTGEHGFAASQTGTVSSVSWTYTRSGLLTSLVERNNDQIVDQWTFTFDEQGNLATATDFNGRSSRAIAYDGAGRLLEAIDLHGVRVKYVYDARARPVSYLYGNNLTTYTYDAIGQLTRQTGPHGRVTHYKYDAAHRLVDVLENGKRLYDGDFGTTNSVARPMSSPDYAGTNPFGRWFGWLTRILDWLFESAQAQSLPAPPPPQVLGAANSMPGTYTPTPWDSMASGTGSRRPWDWLAIWTQRMIDTCTGRKREEHRGRFQAQGAGYRDPGVGDVEAWGPLPNPPTVSSGLAMLTMLESRMNRRQFNDRNEALDKARAYVVRAGENGGIGPRSKSFQNRSVQKHNGSERVDLEVRAGIAFVP